MYACISLKRTGNKWPEVKKRKKTETYDEDLERLDYSIIKNRYVL